MEDEIESPPKRRFVETTESERQDLLDSAKSKRTLISTQTWVKAFGAYCGPSTVDFHAVSASELCERLQGFYAGMRKADGSEYKRASFIAARSALARHVTTFERGFDLIKGPEFKQANKMLDAVLKDKQRNGREPAVQHKQSITDEDWGKIKVYFADVLETRDPRKLTTYTWFVISSHFCLRGSELQARLCKKDLLFETSEGRETIRIATDFITKNTQGGLNGRSFESKGCIDDPQQVSAIKLYLQRLHPDVDRLFQRARAGRGELASAEQSCWFVRQALSHNVLSSMMRNLSENAGLSMPYTNHCVRATSIVHMREAGIQDRQIASVTGHKNIQSLVAYDRLSTKDCSAFAAAIDKKSVSSSVSMQTHSTVHVERKENIPAASGFVLNAAGGHFSNVTFNVMSPPIARKPRFCLSLKRRRELAAAKKIASASASGAAAALTL